MSERERLIDILANSGCTADVETFEDLADHLLKNGVIVPPCKVGDTVWYIRGIPQKRYTRPKKKQKKC